MKRVLLGFLVLGAGVFAFGEETIFDPTRPVSMLGQKEFEVQWYTASECATRLMLREGGEPCNTWKPEGEREDVWKDEARVVEGGTTGNWHRLTVTGLNPCTRYYYRLYDEGTEPTVEEARYLTHSSFFRISHGSSFKSKLRRFSLLAFFMYSATLFMSRSSFVPLGTITASILEPVDFKWHSEISMGVIL